VQCLFRISNVGQKIIARKDCETEANFVVFRDHLFKSNCCAAITYPEIFASKFRYIYRQSGKRKRGKEKGEGAVTGTTLPTHCSNQVATARKKRKSVLRVLKVQCSAQTLL